MWIWRRGSCSDRWASQPSLLPRHPPPLGDHPQHCQMHRVTMTHTGHTRASSPLVDKHPALGTGAHVASRRHTESTPGLRLSERKRLPSHAEVTTPTTTHRHRHRSHTHVDTWGLAPRSPRSHRNIPAQTHAGGGSHTQISRNVRTHNQHVPWAQEVTEGLLGTHAQPPEGLDSFAYTHSDLRGCPGLGKHTHVHRAPRPRVHTHILVVTQTCLSS